MTGEDGNGEPFITNEQLENFRLPDDLKEFYRDAFKAYESAKEEKPFIWSLKITSIVNGFLLEGINDNGVVIQWTVVEPEHDEDGHWIDEPEKKVLTAEKLCYELVEYFCLWSSKHDKVHLRIEVERDEEDEKNGDEQDSEGSEGLEN